MRKIAIVGSRGFRNMALLDFVIGEYILEYNNDITIVSGGCPHGADRLAMEYSSLHSIPFVVFKPNWEVYGKPAGFIRNKQIVDFSDEVIAFWDGTSKGTKHTMDLTKKAGKPLVVIEYKTLNF